MTKDINRIKVVLAEKKHTNKWLAGEIGKVVATISNGVHTLHNPLMRH